MTTQNSFSLDDKYTLEEGTIILSGVQALVRLPMDQHKADKRAGLNTAVFISGYRGSPLGTIDMLLQRNKKMLKEHEVVFVPGVNEDLAATAVLGSQLANLMPQPKYDGVLGMWYGKGPGVDRSGDAFKHAQMTGVGRHGGVLALAGDDPFCKSSTIPSHSEIALYDAQMPVLYPGNAQEVLELGRYGFELSRYSGSWTGFKFVTNVADEYSTADVSPIEQIIKPAFEYYGRPWQHTQNPALLSPHTLHQEQEIHEGRIEAAKLFAAANGLNRITISTEDDWLGIVATGKTYYDVREALSNLGLDDEGLRRYGIRVLKLGMIYPMEPEIVKEFARGLEEIFVVEEKRSFIEMQIRDVLYNTETRPLMVGKVDEHGRFFVPGHSELDTDLITPLLAKRLAKRVPQELLDQRLHILQKPALSLSLQMAGSDASRTPYFCSGCPHNRSTVVPDGSLQGGGIGCHTLAILMDRNITGVTQMGSEGTQWVGAAPFTETKHIFQNIGDGTLFHSGSLAIRQAIAQNTNITYKILYNGAVAMTGGQQADGEIPVPALTRELAAEGAKKIIVCTHDLDKYGPSPQWAAGVDVWERDRLDEAQEILRDIEGVTVLIYDQPCATELRRNRKRGLAHDPAERVFINEAVCEGCGDCGDKSNCLSVFPVETEFGRKTQIHQSSCNKDYTCLEGNCPAFIKVVPDVAAAGSVKTQHSALSTQHPALELENLPEPRQLPPEEGNIYMAGMGGTGVVTVSQILSSAALIDGKFVRSLDQTGLSQKGGPVVSHIKVSAAPKEISNKIGVGEADAYLVFDVLSGTTEKNLSHARPGRSVAVVSSSEIPTGSMVKNIGVQFPQGQLLKHRVEMYTDREKNVYLDAVKLSENLFGSHMPANIMVIGAAYQAGLIPITALAIEHAIGLNGVAVEMNKTAFRIGRLIVADPNWEASLELERVGAQTIKRPELSAEARPLVDMVGAEGELLRLLEIRVPELIAYQDVGYAREYVEFVKRVHDVDEDGRIAEGVARYLFKLMAYKDEYEVARLQLKPEFQEALEAQFGKGADIKYQLHPPILKALGLKNKIGFGRWFDGVYRLLARMKGLRGTRWDLFGRDEVRRTERALIGEYRSLIERELAELSPETVERAVVIANLPDVIRGYDEVKLENVARFRAAVREARGEGVGVAGD